jgi:hypothetical protein
VNERPGMILDDLKRQRNHYAIASGWDGGINVGLGNERNRFEARERATGLLIAHDCVTVADNP